MQSAQHLAASGQGSCRGLFHRPSKVSCLSLRTGAACFSEASARRPRSWNERVTFARAAARPQTFAPTASQAHRDNRTQLAEARHVPHPKRRKARLERSIRVSAPPHSGSSIACGASASAKAGGCCSPTSILRTPGLEEPTAQFSNFTTCRHPASAAVRGFHG